MERLIKITVEFENETELRVFGLKDSIYYEPEINELVFKNAGNGKVTLNTLYAKKIIIDNVLVKGNVMCYR